MTQLVLVKFNDVDEQVYMEKQKAVKFTMNYDDVTMEVKNTDQ